MRDDDEASVGGARRARNSKERLTVVADALRDKREKHPGSREAAIEILKRARGNYNHTVQYDSYGWARDLDKLTRMIEVREEIDELEEPKFTSQIKPIPDGAKTVVHRDRSVARWTDSDGTTCEAPIVHASDGTERIEIARTVMLTEAQHHTLEDLREEHRSLGMQLGYEHPFDCRALDDMFAIARAVATGHGTDPEHPPADWPETRHWLRKPAVWDPDCQVGGIVSETIREGELLLRSRDDSRLRLAWCIDLALDTDRSVLSRMLGEAGEDNCEIAGVTQDLLDFIVEGCSPIRWGLAWSWGTGKDENPARAELVALHGTAGAADGFLDDLAESATAIDLSLLDADLLELAEELVETFADMDEAGTTAKEPPKGGPAEQAEREETLKGWKVAGRCQKRRKAILHVLLCLDAGKSMKATAIAGKERVSKFFGKQSASARLSAVGKDCRAMSKVVDSHQGTAGYRLKPELRGRVLWALKKE